MSIEQTMTLDEKNIIDYLMAGISGLVVGSTSSEVAVGGVDFSHRITGPDMRVWIERNGGAYAIVGECDGMEPVLLRRVPLDHLRVVRSVRKCMMIDCTRTLAEVCL